LKLVIVGQDSYKEMVKDIPNVTVHGYIEWEKLQRLYYDAALFAMPAIMEPWGQVYVEALECKTPILGLNRNSLPEITQNGRFGFLVDQATPEKVADAILEAYSDPQRLQQMGEAGQKYCLENFSWHHVATKIAAGISSVQEDKSILQRTNR
jgi:glycosyltransferase involved in cell wall biosynthesis